MVDNPQELIATLKTQHRGLQNDLSLTVDELKSNTTLDGSAIASKLAKFKTDLLEHLELENKKFYPDYLDKKEVKGEATAPTKEFIKKMDNIGKIVMAFLDKYSSLETIESSGSTLASELNSIIATLNTRIETEEEGVYDIYLTL